MLGLELVLPLAGRPAACAKPSAACTPSGPRLSMGQRMMRLATTAWRTPKFPPRMARPPSTRTLSGCHRHLPGSFPRPSSLSPPMRSLVSRALTCGPFHTDALWLSAFCLAAFWKSSADCSVWPARSSAPRSSVRCWRLASTVARFLIVASCLVSLAARARKKSPSSSAVTCARASAPAPGPTASGTPPGPGPVLAVTSTCFSTATAYAHAVSQRHQPPTPASAPRSHRPGARTRRAQKWREYRIHPRPRATPPARAAAGPGWCPSRRPRARRRQPRWISAGRALTLAACRVRKLAVCRARPTASLPPRA
jgi:hypothetical protein